MSNVVDNRVVSMEFDNSKFEKNVETSLGTLRHLDDSLNKIDGASFDKLSGSVNAIANKFTFLGTLSRRIFETMADDVINAGKRMVSGFTIDQMASGWDKYAEKTTSVQTIMSATGDSIEYVTEQLEKLNWFTDETSYNFTDMTSNIAKFTSQGIALDDAVNEMQGIALWAASAGQNAQAASRAMYNISQAMGAGAMKLIDWKSIQNANMATKEFKEQAIEAAVAVGSLAVEGDHWVTVAKGTEVTLKNFDQSLADGWLNSAAMEMVFSKYGMFAEALYDLSDASGLTATELLEMYDCFKSGGDIQDEFANELNLSNISAEELLETFALLNTEAYALGEKAFRLGQEAKTFGDAMDATADAVSTAWMNLFETIFGNYEQQKKIWTDLSVSMYDWFAEPINNITSVLREAMNFGQGESPFGDLIRSTVKEFEEGSFQIEHFSGEMLTGLGDMAIKGAKAYGLLTDEMIQSAGSAEAALSSLVLTGRDVDNITGYIWYNSAKSVDRLGEYGTTIENQIIHIKAVAERLIKDGTTSEEEVHQFALRAYEDFDNLYFVVQKLQSGAELTNEDLAYLASNIGQYGNEQDEIWRSVRDQIEGAVSDYKDVILDASDAHSVFGQLYDDAYENLLLYEREDALSKTSISIKAYQELLEELGKHTNEMTDEQIEYYHSLQESLDKTSWHYQMLFAEMEGKDLPINDTFKTAIDDLTVFGNTAENILRKHGYLTDDLVKQYGSVDEAMRHLKIPASEYRDILNEIQKNSSEMTEEQRESIIAYQKNLTDIINEYNTLDAKIEEISGRELLFNPDFGAFYNLLNIVTAIGEIISRAWNNVFTGDKTRLAYNFIKALQQGTSSILSFLTDSEEETHRLERILTGVFSLLDIGKQAIVAIFDGAKRILQMFGFVGEGALEGAAGIADWITALDQSIKENQIFGKGVGYVVDILGKFISIAKDAAGKVKELYNRIKELEQVQKIANWIEEHFNKALEKIPELVDKASKWLNENFNSALEAIPGLVGLACDALLIGFDSILKFFTKTIPNWYRTIVNYISNFDFSKILNFFKDVKDAAVDLFNMIKQLVITGDWDQFVAAFTERFPKISEVILNVKDTISKFFSYISENGPAFLKRVLTGLITLISVLLTIKTVLSFNKVLDSLSGFLDTIGDTLSGVKKAPKILAIVGIAAALAVIIYEVKMLAEIPEDDLKRALFAIGIVGGILVALEGIAAIAAGLKLDNGISTAGTGVLKFAASLGIIALALIGLSNLPLENLGASIITLVGIMAALTLAATFMSKHALTLSVGGSGLIMYALAVLVLAKALKQVQDNAEGLSIEAFRTLIGIMAALAVLSFVIKGVKFGGALGVLLLAFSLVQIEKALMNAIENAIPFETFKQYWKELLSIVTILAGFALITRLTGKGSIKGVLSLLALIGLLYLLPGVIQKLGAIPSDQLWQGVATIAIIGTVLAGIIATTSMIVDMSKQGVKALTVLIVGIAAILVALYFLKDSTMDELLPAVIAIGIVMVALGIAIGLAMTPISKASSIDGKAIAGLVVILVAIGGVIAALWWLSTQDLPALPQVAYALAAVMVALGVALFAVGNKWYEAPSFVEAIQTMFQALLILVPVIGALWAIQALGIEASIETVGALSILLVALTACMALLSLTKSDWKQSIANGAALAVASTSLIAIAYALSLMKDINLDGISSKILILGGVLIELSVCLAIMSLIPNPAAVGTALLGLLGIIAIIALLMIAVANLGPDNDKMMEVAPKVTNGFALLGEAIGAFIGGFLGGIGIGMTHSMIQMAENLCAFAEKLQPFLNSIGQITDEQVRGMDALTALMLKLAAAELLNALSNILNGFDLFKTDLGDKLQKFAGAIVGYLDALKNVNVEDIQKGVTLTESFAKLFQALPRNGGLLQVFTGGANLKNFAKQIATYGESLAAFCISIASVNESSIAQAEIASLLTDSVVEIADKLPKVSGEGLAFFTSTSQPKKFGEGMASYMESLVSITKSASGLTESDNVNLLVAKTLTNVITEMGDTIPEMSSKFKTIFSDYIDYRSYGEQMSDYISSLVTIADTSKGLNGVELANIDNAKAMSIVLVSIAELIPQVQSGFQSLFYSHDDQGLFGERMTKFMQELIMTADAASQIPQNALATISFAKEATSALVDLLKIIPSSSIFSNNSIANTGDVVVFGSSIKQFAIAMKNYVDEISGLEANDAKKTTEYLVEITSQLLGLSGKFGSIATNVGSVVTSFDNALSNIKKNCDDILIIIIDFTGKFEEAGTNLIAAYIKGIKANQNGGALTAGSEVAHDVLTGLSSEDWEKAGYTVVVTYISGIMNEKYALQESGRFIVEMIAEGIDSVGQDLTYSYGQYFAIGFADGMYDQIGYVQSAAADLGYAAAEALAAAAQIYSPSRIAKGLGGYFGEGWVIGIQGMYNAAEDAADGLAENTIDAVAYAKEAAENLLNSDYDPVIRPIIDLSEVESAVNSIPQFDSVYSVTGAYKAAETGVSIDEARRMKQSSINANDSILNNLNKYLDTDRDFNVSIRVDKMAVRSEEDITAISKQLAKEVRVALRQKPAR